MLSMQREFIPDGPCDKSFSFLAAHVAETGVLYTL